MTDRQPIRTELPATLRRRGRFAFTMTEIIAVLVVMAVLAAGAVVGLQKVVSSSKDESTKNVAEAVVREAVGLAIARGGGRLTIADLTHSLGDIPDASAAVVAAAGPVVAAGGPVAAAPASVTSAPFACGGSMTQFTAAELGTNPDPLYDPGDASIAQSPVQYCYDASQVVGAAPYSVSLAVSGDGYAAGVAMRSPTGKVIYARQTFTGEKTSRVVDASGKEATGAWALLGYVPRASDSIPGLDGPTTTVPDTPAQMAAPSATAGYLSATVNWVAVADGSPAAGYGQVTGYRVVAVEDGTKTCTTTRAATSCSIAGLTAGTTYHFTVTVTNDGTKTSATSPQSNAVVPWGDPAKPAAPTAAAGYRSATVTWPAVADNTAASGYRTVSGYTVTASTGAGSCSVPAGTTSCVVTGLAPAVPVSFTVKVTTDAGLTSVASNASNVVTPFDVPGAPTGLAGTPGNAQVALTWTAPAANGGSAITGYRVDYKLHADTTWTTFIANSGSTTTSATVTALTNGASYDFRVAAINTAGAGPASTPAGPYVPFTVPNAPTNVVATGSDLTLNLSWSAPAFDGGRAITGYKIERAVSTDDGATFGAWTTVVANTASTATTWSTTGTASRAYQFRVSAINVAGTGAAATSNTARTRPDIPVVSMSCAPAMFGRAASDGKCSGSWTKPVGTTYFNTTFVDGRQGWPDFPVCGSCANTVQERNNLPASTLTTTAAYGGLLQGYFGWSGWYFNTLSVQACNDAGCGPWPTLFGSEVNKGGGQAAAAPGAANVGAGGCGFLGFCWWGLQGSWSTSMEVGQFWQGADGLVGCNPGCWGGAITGMWTQQFYYGGFYRLHVATDVNSPQGGSTGWLATTPGDFFGVRAQIKDVRGANFIWCTPLGYNTPATIGSTYCPVNPVSGEYVQ